MSAIRQRGFTLIEMVVTVAIVGVLATMLLPLTEVAARRSKEQELRSALREIRAAIDAYKRAHDEGRITRIVGQSGYPASLEVLVEGVVDARSPQRQRIYFLRRIPADPMATDGSVPAAQTWGLRSYDSPANDPRPGRDVFDVHSRATGVGLNGRPYAQW